MEGASEFAKEQFRKARQILDDAKLDFDPSVDWTPESDFEFEGEDNGK